MKRSQEDKTPSEEDLERLERMTRHWELKHHVRHKMLMSPTVAAAIIALVGTIVRHSRLL
jgi:hypothetical protein